MRDVDLGLLPLLHPKESRSSDEPGALAAGQHIFIVLADLPTTGAFSRGHLLLAGNPGLRDGCGQLCKRIRVCLQHADGACAALKAQ